jgi:hypothetical protein
VSRGAYREILEWETGTLTLDAMSRFAEALETGSLGRQRAHAERLVDVISDLLVDAAHDFDVSVTYNDGYRQLARNLSLLLARCEIENPNPHRTLRDWKTSLADLGPDCDPFPSVRDMYEPVYVALEQLDRRRLARPVADARTGWPDVDEKIDQLHRRFATADDVDDYRDVGRRAVGVLEAAAKALEGALDERAVPQSDRSPKDYVGQLRRLTEAVQGAEHQEARKLIRALADVADRASAAAEAQAALADAITELGGSAIKDAQQAKHAARLEAQAGIAADTAILTAAITRRVLTLYDALEAEQQAVTVRDVSDHDRADRGDRVERPV